MKEDLKNLKKIIKQINKSRDDELDEAFFEDYDYQTLSMLTISDYQLESEILKKVLDIIKLIGYRLNCMDELIPYLLYSSVYFITSLLKTKEDYIYLENLFQKYNIALIEEYSIENNVSNINEITIESLDKYFEEKERYEKELPEIEKILNYVAERYRPKQIRNVKEAINYCYLHKFLLENGVNLDSFVRKYDEFHNLVQDFNINHYLSPADIKLKNNLLEYVSLKLNIPYFESFSINNTEELSKYDTLKKNYLDSQYINDNNNITWLEYLIVSPSQIIDLQYIKDKCNNLSKIANFDESLLIREYGFNKLELLFIKLFSLKEKFGNDWISMVYKYCSDNNINFKKIDFEHFINQLRVVYGKEISDSLTKLNSQGESQKSCEAIYKGDSEYGVPLYEKENGHFQLLVHSIFNMPINNIYLNSKVYEKYGEPRRYFDTPELWNIMNREEGTTALSTSLICETECSFMGSLDIANCVLYGYDELNPSSIRNMSSQDAATPHDINGADLFGGTREEMIFPDELIKKTTNNYNEVAFNAYMDSDKRKKPNFILCFDTINNESVAHAKYHQVPILLIKTKKFIEDLEKLINGYQHAIQFYRNRDSDYDLEHYYSCLDDLETYMYHYRLYPDKLGSKTMNITEDMIREVSKEKQEVFNRLKEKNKYQKTGFGL